MRSLWSNSIGPVGTAALAKVLAKTKIQTLECAAAEAMQVIQAGLQNLVV